MFWTLIKSPGRIWFGMTSHQKYIRELTYLLSSISFCSVWTRIWPSEEPQQELSTALICKIKYTLGNMDNLIWCQPQAAWNLFSHFNLSPQAPLHHNKLKIAWIVTCATLEYFAADLTCLFLELAALRTSAWQSPLQCHLGGVSQMRCLIWVNGGQREPPLMNSAGHTLHLFWELAVNLADVRHTLCDAGKNSRGVLQIYLPSLVEDIHLPKVSITRCIF